MSAFDFTRQPDRQRTGSLKWDRYAGKDVLPFWVADMDFRSPPAVEAALAQRVTHGIYGYTLSPPETVEATLAYLADTHGIQAQAEWLVWLPGLVPALNASARAFANEGEGILTVEPVYPPFLSAPPWQGRTLQTGSMAWEGRRAAIDWASVDQAVDHSTKSFTFCNPHNPTGRVYTPEEVARVLEFCEAHDLVLVSDEIHCDLILTEGLRHVSALQFPAAHERTVALFAASKTYNLAGLACAYAVIPNPKLRARFERAKRGMITEVNCLGYTATAAAYREGGPWRQALLEVLRAHYARLQTFIAEECPALRLMDLEATYLGWIDARELPVDNPIAHFEEHGIGLSNGADFGAPGWLRFNFGCTATMLEAGLSRLKAGYDAAMKG